MIIDRHVLTSILLYVFIVFSGINLFYVLFFYIRVPFWKKKKYNKSDKLPPVTVIITARNEALNLDENLKYFLTQDYPDFQVVVVNDASTDDSATVLAKLKLEYDNLYVSTIPYDPIYKHGKKTALSIGIKAAKNDILLFSDADCKPISNQWIKSIVKYFDDKTDIVIGAAGYEQTKGLLNKIIRADAIFIAMQYLGFALARIPYMGVGRNMAFRKSFFQKTKGYIKHINLLSGSDDLFINENSNRKNLKVALDAESLIISKPKYTMKEWIRQKTRHYTTGKYYKFYHKILLFFEPLSRVIYYGLGIYLLIQNEFFYITLSIFILRFISFLLVLIYTNKTLKQRNILITEIFFDVFQPFINLFLYIKSNEKYDYLWK